MEKNTKYVTAKQQEEIDGELIYFGFTPSFNEIIDNIFIGNYAFALNKHLLLENKITHILNCGVGLKNFYEQEKKFKYHYIPLYDSENQKVGKYLDDSNKFIEEGCSNGNKILIHCGAGMSRSVTMLYMYLLIKKGYTLTQARQIVKTKRKCARPNDGFRKQLEQKSYELYNRL